MNKIEKWLEDGTKGKMHKEELLNDVTQGMSLRDLANKIKILSRGYISPSKRSISNWISSLSQTIRDERAKHVKPSNLPKLKRIKDFFSGAVEEKPLEECPHERYLAKTEYDFANERVVVRCGNCGKLLGYADPETTESRWNTEKLYRSLRK